MHHYITVLKAQGAGKTTGTCGLSLRVIGVVAVPLISM